MSTTEYNGSELVVRALKELNVKYIFGYPGGSVLDLYDALFQQEDIEHILVRHEQAATHMADGYARATGDVGTGGRHRRRCGGDHHLWRLQTQLGLLFAVVKARCSSETRQHHQQVHPQHHPLGRCVSTFEPFARSNDRRGIWVGDGGRHGEGRLVPEPAVC